MSKPTGAVGEWKITEATASRDNRTYIGRTKWGRTYFRETVQITYSINVDDTCTSIPAVCDPGGLEAQHYKCESRTFTGAYGTRLSGTYSETWVLRGDWQKYDDDPDDLQDLDPSN